MSRDRLEAFGDGVIAFLITSMVLELATPASQDGSAFAALTPRLLSHALSFDFLDI